MRKCGNLARWLFMSTINRMESDADWRLTPGQLVIVDEARQAATPALHTLLAQITEAGGRLLTVGDPRQLGAPGAGGALDRVTAEAGSHQLTEVRRFRDHTGAPRRCRARRSFHRRRPARPASLPCAASA